VQFAKFAILDFINLLPYMKPAALKDDLSRNALQK